MQIVDKLLDRSVRYPRDYMQVLHGEVHYFGFSYECEEMSIEDGMTDTGYWLRRALRAEDKVMMLESENDKLKRELALYRSASSYPRGEE
jgi:hypothetical protein